MNLGTFIRFFVGDRRAILAIAANRNALWLGAVFVLSAALAREYDQTDLLAEPWHLLIPFAASLIAAALLYGFVFLPDYRADKSRPRCRIRYGEFLGLFWMTAPLAWLYAIPYERFLSPIEATYVNLWTLGLVAAWRVLLMARVISVLTGGRFVAALFFVMLVADPVAFATVAFSPKPIITGMGGLPPDDPAGIVNNVGFAVLGLSFVTLPVWLIGALLLRRRLWGPNDAIARPEPTSCAPGPVVLAPFSVAIWFVFLPFTQAEQRLATRVENLILDASYGQAIDLMAKHEPVDFPPDWSPPRQYRLDELRSLAEVTMYAPEGSWVRRLYAERIERWLDPERARYGVDEAERKQLGDLRDRLRSDLTSRALITSRPADGVAP